LSCPLPPCSLCPTQVDDIILELTQLGIPHAETLRSKGKKRKKIDLWEQLVELRTDTGSVKDRFAVVVAMFADASGQTLLEGQTRALAVCMSGGPDFRSATVDEPIEFITMNCKIPAAKVGAIHVSRHPILMKLELADLARVSERACALTTLCSSGASG
jgi:hypothetical protein